MGMQPAFRRCVLLAALATTLCFGWWPFSFFQANDVRWVEEESALRFNADYEEGAFHARGVVYSEGVLDTRQWEGLSIVVELKGRPRGKALGVFLEFFEEGERGLPPLLLAQWQDHLAMRSRRPLSEEARGYAEIGHRGAFEGDRYRRLVLSSRGNRTFVGLDGELVETRSDFALLGPDNRFRGRLALGNSADGKRPFTGEIRRVALYDRFYREGTAAFEAAVPVLEYEFSFGGGGGEGARALVELARGLGLAAPEKLQVAQRRFFNPIGSTQWEKPGMRSDMVVNVLGFIPVGLCFAAAARRRFESFLAVAVATAAASFCLSFGIEWSQAYLAHRDSSQLDLLLNTVSGTLATLVPRRWILFL